MNLTPEEINEACRKMRETLNRPMSAKEAQIIALFDQVRAECRDDPAKREAVIQMWMEDGVSRRDAGEWVDQ